MRFLKRTIRNLALANSQLGPCHFLQLSKAECDFAEQRLVWSHARSTVIGEKEQEELTMADLVKAERLERMAREHKERNYDNDEVVNKIISGIDERIVGLVGEDANLQIRNRRIREDLLAIAAHHKASAFNKDKRIFAPPATRFRDSVWRKLGKIFSFSSETPSGPEMDTVEHHYGVSEKPADMYAKLGNDIKPALEHLSEADSKTIIEDFTGTSPDAVPTVDEVWEAMTRATPSQLKKYFKFQHHGHEVFHDHAVHHAYESLIDLRTVTIVQTDKMFARSERLKIERSEVFVDGLKEGKGGDEIAKKGFKEVSEDLKKEAKDEAENLKLQADKIIVTAETKAQELLALDEDKAPLAPLSERQATAKELIKNANTRAEELQTAAKEIVAIAEKRANRLLQSNPDEIAEAEKAAHKIIFEKMASKEALNDLTSHQYRVLMAELEQLYKKVGPLDFKKELDELLLTFESNVERKSEKSDEKSPASVENRGKINESKGVLFNEGKRNELLVLYGKADAVNKRLISAKNEVDTNDSLVKSINSIPRASRSRDDIDNLKMASGNLKEANARLNQEQKEQERLLGDINKFEGEFLGAARTITAIFNNAKELNATENPELNKLKTDLADKERTSLEGLSSTPIASDIFIFLKKFREEKLQEEITAYDLKLNPRAKVSWEELLFKLNQRKFKKLGKTNDMANAKCAMLASNLDLIDAKPKSLDAHKAANKEIAESLRTGIRGFFRRKYQGVAKHFFSTDVFGLEKIIEHSSGADDEGAFEVFAHLNDHMSAADILHMVREHGGISVDKLKEYIAVLDSILYSTKLGHHGEKTIEVADADAQRLEKVRDTLVEAQGLLIVEENVALAQNPKDEKFKGKTPVQIMAMVMKEQQKAEAAKDVEIQSKIGKYLNLFWSKILGKEIKDKVHPAFDEYRAAKKAGKVDGQSFKEWLHHEHKHIAGSVVSAAEKALAVKEVIDIGAGVIQKVGTHLSKGATATGKVVNNIRERRAASKAEAAKIKAEAKEAAEKAAQSVVANDNSKPVRPFRESLLGRAITGPFRLAGWLLGAPGRMWDELKARNRAENARATAKIQARKARAPQKIHGGAHGAAANDGGGHAHAA